MQWNLWWGGRGAAAHPAREVLLGQPTLPVHVCCPGASATAQEPLNESLLPRGCPRVEHCLVPGSPVTWCPLPATGSVPREVHRHRLHAALLQTDAEQAPDAEGPGVHRPRVLQLHCLDQVSALPCLPQSCPHSPSLLLGASVRSHIPVSPAGRTAWRSAAWSCTSSRTWRSWAR